MQIDELVIQCLMRDRLAEAQQRAMLGALRRQSSYGSPDGKGIWQRLIDLGRSLVKRSGSEVPKSPRRATALRASRSTR
jgi:hypothetical protein